jgi:hypothetical protein
LRCGITWRCLGVARRVWWNPSILTLDVQEPLSVRQQRILEADEDSAEAMAGEKNYLRWNDARSTAVARASRASIQVPGLKVGMSEKFGAAPAGLNVD